MSSASPAPCPPPTKLTPLAVAVLALLRERPMHPYEMYQVLVNRREDRMVKIRRGSLYHVVERLVTGGEVEVAGTEREGNRPERTTYAITEHGNTALLNWITGVLAEPSEDRPPFVLALSEIHNLPRDGALDLIAARLTWLREDLAELDEIDASTRRMKVQPIFVVGLQYLRAMCRAQVTWLEEFERDLRTNSVKWLGSQGCEPAPVVAPTATRWERTSEQTSIETSEGLS